MVCETNFDQAISDLSQYFLPILKRNSMPLDGRQVGNTKIDPTVEIAQGVFIGENVEIAEKSVIMPGCVIMPGTKIS